MVEISGVLGTILGAKDTTELHKDFVNFKDFCTFHVYVSHPNGTQNLKIEKYDFRAF